MPKDSEPPPKAKNPCCHKIDDPAGRNLVITIDGLQMNMLGGTSMSNVTELYNMLDKDDTQLTWNNGGSGAFWTQQNPWKFEHWKAVLYRNIDSAIGWEFKTIVLGAYKWLSENYRKGDRIFLFGFSRGAYQVRVLSAMISKVGLINKGNEVQIPSAYELYVNSDKNTPEYENNADMGAKDGFIVTKHRISAAERFKRRFSHRDVKVHFVGVWDTVASIGILSADNFSLPGITDGMKHVCFFRHALALDERRAIFIPQFAYGRSGVPEEDSSGKIPRIKEVWFAGTHFDIGGGNTGNANLDRTRPPLRWMIFEAGPLGLRTTQFTRDLLNKELTNVKGSLIGMWWLLEYIPLRLLNYSRDTRRYTITWQPHLAKQRKIQPGQKIHNSLLSSTTYTPNASPPTEDHLEFWKNLQSAAQKTQEKTELYETWVEMDLYDHILDTVHGSIAALGPSISFEMLRDVSERNEGKRALYDAVMDILADESVTREIKNLIMKKCIEILDPHLFSFRKRDFVTVVNKIQGLEAEEGKVDPFVKQFLFHFCHFSYRSASLQTDNASEVFSVTFSSDGKRLISGSSDATVYIWNADEPHSSFPLIDHKNSVFSVAISPDRRYIVSASKDDTLRLWDMEKRTQVGVPWKSHTGAVNCAVFSNDSKRVVSGSDDGTIRIWDVETGTQIGESLTGHQAGIQSIALSPDGTLLVSGSDDHTLRIWDVEKYLQVGVPLEGHTGDVLSTAFSPNGKRILSGSRDMTIRIWDAATHRQIGPQIPTRASVMSICSSPDDKLLFFGTDDNTVWIWDAETGKQMGERLRGHSRTVACVACAPDGKSLVSASLDGTIRMWNIETHAAWSRL